MNINSALIIPDYFKTFIENVTFNNFNLLYLDDSFEELTKNIPIFLVNETTIDKIRNDLYLSLLNDYLNSYRDTFEGCKKKEFLNRKYNGICPPTEWLGLYTRTELDNLIPTSHPVIFVCPERIKSITNNQMDYMFILTKVIIHELMHALMDNGGKRPDIDSELYIWMEESFANKLTLMVIHNYIMRLKIMKQDEELFLDLVIKFVKNQPPMYALGYELFEKDIGWWIHWKKFKSLNDHKNKVQDIENLLNYLKANFKNVDEKKANELLDKLWF